MGVKADHVAGGFFVAAGVVVFALSGDLPVGSLASPGAGLLPKLVTALMMLLGLVVALRGAKSRPLGALGWSDLPHALQVLAVTAVVVSLYTTLGFVASVLLLLLGLTAAVERLGIVRALVFSAVTTAVIYALFVFLLKVPLPAGTLWRSF